MIKDDKKRTHIIVTGKGGGSDAGAVRFDEAQVLTEEEKTQARNNIGAADVNDIPTATSDLDNDSGFITINDVPAQVNADWNAVSGVAEILNKPTLATVATSGDYDDLQNKPTIPAAQVQSDWNQSDNTAVDYIKNKPTIPAAQVQSDWNESDTSSLAYIANKPTIPAAQVNADWNAVSGVAEILNKPVIPTVPIMSTETLTFTMQDSTTKTITFCTVKTGYFYVEDVSGSDNTLSIIKSNANAPTIEVFKSTDQLNWESMGSTSTTAITATVPANGKLYLKATTNYWTNDNNECNHISCNANHNVGGNSMSLIYGDNFENKTTFPAGSGKMFAYLFDNNTYLKNAENLELPATQISKGGYGYMFNGCTSLTTAPALPATTLGIASYNYMFQGCTSLTTAPALPATNVNQWSYRAMFNGCTALTTPPALPATTMGNNCYYEMFAGCTSLTTAPTLPATTVGSGCYYYMFNGCTSLNQIITYADTISDNWSIREWVSGVAATGDFYNLGSATYTADSASGIPSGWTEHTSL